MIAARTPSAIDLATVQIGNLVGARALDQLIAGLTSRMRARPRLINRVVTGRDEWPPDMPLTAMLRWCADSLREEEAMARLAPFTSRRGPFLVHHILAAQDALLAMIMEE